MEVGENRGCALFPLFARATPHLTSPNLGRGDGRGEKKERERRGEGEGEGEKRRDKLRTRRHLGDASATFLFFNFPIDDVNIYDLDDI